MADGGGAHGLSPRRTREPLPDALRALALIGVLLVNALGYQDAPYGRLLGSPRPPDSLQADVLIGLVAAFVQGKAYPLLAFLFGLSMVYAARGRPREQAVQGARRRAGRLLALGVLHGILLYFGDILTMYALCAFWTAWQLRDPWSVLRRRLRTALVLALLAALGAATLALVAFGPVGPASTIGNASGVADFLAVNASTYVAAQTVGLLLTLPLVRLSMLAGVAAGRLRLLQHRRWRALAQRIVRRAAVPALLANGAYGLAYAAMPARATAGTAALESASALWTTPLAAVYAAAAVGLWHAGVRAWVHALAPLGRHTLSVYVATSVLLLAAFSGLGLALQPSTAQWMLAALGLWAVAAIASRLLPGRWPLEAWMGRR